MSEPKPSVTPASPWRDAAGPEPPDDRLARLLECVASPQPASPVGFAPAIAPDSLAPPASALGVAGLVALGEGSQATITRRGTSRSEPAQIAPEVDRELLKLALDNRDSVLVDWQRGSDAVIVGVLQTRLPSELHFRARKIEIEAEQELLIRSGRSALLMTQGGRIELVGTHISAASRGLFRLVGRMLRLN